MATPDEFRALMAVLAAAYPKEASVYANAETVQVYQASLSDIPGQLLLQATREHVNRSTWFPSIAELRSMTYKLRELANPIPNAHAAWAEVVKELRRVGHQGGQQFSHPLIARVVDQFGWRYLCESENLVSDRSQFIRAYQECCEQERFKEQLHPETNMLIGALLDEKRNLLPE